MPRERIEADSGTSQSEFDVGHRLRQIRAERHMTLRQLSELSGLTRSFLSQVENGRVSPSVASMQKIAGGLGISLGTLFTAPANHTPVVRRGERPRLRYPVAGVRDELLTPTTAGSLQVLYASIQANGSSGPELYTHDTDAECIVVLAGTLEVRLDTETYVLDEGDAITFSSRTPHGWLNPNGSEVQCIWVSTPAGFYA